MWLETMQPTSSHQTDEKYRYALRLVKQKYYVEAGQIILQLWPHYRFDGVLARCLVELFSRGYVDNDPQHQLWIKEARWTFESQDFKPEWYLKLKHNTVACNGLYINPLIYSSRYFLCEISYCC